MEQLAIQTVAVTAEKMTRPIRSVIMNAIVEVVLGSTVTGMVDRCRKEIDLGHLVMQPVLASGDVDDGEEARWTQSLWQSEEFLKAVHQASSKAEKKRKVKIAVDACIKHRQFSESTSSQARARQNIRKAAEARKRHASEATGIGSSNTSATTAPATTPTNAGPCHPEARDSSREARPCGCTHVRINVNINLVGSPPQDQIRTATQAVVEGALEGVSRNSLRSNETFTVDYPSQGSEESQDPFMSASAEVGYEANVPPQDGEEGTGEADAEDGGDAGDEGGTVNVGLTLSV